MAKICYTAKDPLITFRKALIAAEQDHEASNDQASFIEFLREDLEDELEHRAKSAVLNPAQHSGQEQNEVIKMPFTYLFLRVLKTAPVNIVTRLWTHYAKNDPKVLHQLIKRLANF